MTEARLQWIVPSTRGRLRGWRHYSEWLSEESHGPPCGVIGSPTGVHGFVRAQTPTGLTSPSHGREGDELSREKPESMRNNEDSRGRPNPPREGVKMDSIQSRADVGPYEGFTLNPRDSTDSFRACVLRVQAVYRGGHPRDLGLRAVHLPNQAEAGCVPVGVAQCEGAGRTRPPDASRQPRRRRGELRPSLLHVGLRGTKPV